ncbi:MULTISPECIES: cache domain-containing protein [unclassified Colwellia]|uniref:cache domain-containing protein n=1 Tax=unclassified Colwellia TaxID=196834 RepID=UPI0015F730F8|nr:MULTISPECIES: cache domain-containing protein [unclassified Colwellia]MBA6256227.1 cache domain-containing protein [Colwellia sp. MB3u-28]MBA6260111.1 cache domain-containing protein [Colwellia sp. MB3u-41]MBA6234409.1 cache domain-containing protein [Colwellia sp. MB02u-7]MBA6236830.1 cache domain-containing protein [Colwellia sp. MB02u-11]MBA6300030.1 cache domain-containing protein [Colwellia sp. MB3u-22]
MIIHPFKPQLNNKPVGQVKDPDGTPLFLNMVDIVKEKGQGCMPYKWPKPGLEKPVDNIYAEQRNLLLLVSFLLAVAMGFIVYY